MRYVKVLILVGLFFLCTVFLFQNQDPLSQKLTLSLSLLAIPTMTSIELPFYFVVLASFLVGAIFATIILLWDRMQMSAKLMRATWQMQAMENQERKLIKQMEELANTEETERPAMFARIRAEYTTWKDKLKKKKKNKNEIDVDAAIASVKNK